MVWPWLLIFLIYLQLQIRFSFLDELQNISVFLHHLCLKQVPVSSTTQPALSALVCGKNFDRLSDMQLYSSTGLIHLFVVSGSHLILIQKSLTPIMQILFDKIWMWWLIGGLFIYCAMCLFNPPVTRSFIFLLLIFVLHQNHRPWPRHYVLLLAGLFTLLFHSPWVTSLSLQMSWIAALALELYAQKLRLFPLLLRQIIFYFLFLFSFMGLGFPQASTILLCWLVTPVLEYLLFPFAVLTVLWHPLEPLFRLFMDGLNASLTALAFSSSSGTLPLSTVIYLNWMVIFLCHFLLFFSRSRS